MSDVTYVGEEELNGQAAFKWSAGDDDHVYWETNQSNPTDRIPMRTDLDNDVNSEYIFDFFVLVLIVYTYLNKSFG